MLRHRISSFHRSFPSRALSNVAAKYSPKVRAFPFKISPQDAIIRMGPFASQECLYKDILGSIGASFLPGMGFTPIQPTRIQPVYFPAWIIDAEVEAGIIVSSESESESEQHIATAVLSSSYMPGFALEPLYKVSLNPTSLQEYEPVPFSRDLEHQYNADVSCLPFTISPLSLLDAAPALPYKDAKISEDIRFIPSSVKPRLLAVYPILIPLYLARYEFQLLNTTQSVTVVHEGFSERGRIIIQKRISSPLEAAVITMRNPQTLDDFAHVLVNDECVTLGGDAPFARVDRFMTPLSNERFGIKLGQWLDGLVHSQTFPHFVKDSSVDMGDIRVREYTRNETRKNRLWMAMGVEVANMKALVQAMSGKSPKMIQVMGSRQPADTEKLADSVVTMVKANVDELELKRTQVQPSWWKDWQAQSSSTPGRSTPKE